MGPKDKVLTMATLSASHKTCRELYRILVNHVPRGRLDAVITKLAALPGNYGFRETMWRVRAIHEHVDRDEVPDSWPAELREVFSKPL